MASKSTKLPQGITLKTLQEYWDTAYREYYKAFRRIVLLDATDRSRLWDVVGAKFPDYQILPDTNHVAYVKNNLVASIYTVGKSAKLMPTSQEDKTVVENYNIALEHYWGVCKVAKFQRQAGDRAALCNLGLTQVGWDATKKRPTYKNIDPTRFMRDPHALDLDSAPYCIAWEYAHINVLKANPDYTDGFKNYVDKPATTAAPVELYRDRPTDSTTQNRKGYVKLIVYWVREGNKVHEIHTVDNEHVLLVQEDIKPSMFPIAELYCNDPAGDLIGTSEPAKIFANSVAYNLMDSVMLTSEYKNQRPPKFVSSNASLDVMAFIKHGNEADRTFIVNGDASRAVHYHQFPQPGANMPNNMSRLDLDIQKVSGVDGRYTGRDTGSILTTGGMEAALNQVTMIDTAKVANYEDYARKLTELTIYNLLEFGTKRKYFVHVPGSNSYRSIEVDFTKAKADTIFDYEINVSSELPKNKQRIAQMANTLMEKQMQYAQQGGGQGQPDLITPEEWLMLQDFPMKEYFMERMKIQRMASYEKRVMETITTFSELVKTGVAPGDAISMTAEQLRANDTPMMGGMPELPEVGAPEQPMPQDMGMGY